MLSVMSLTNAVRLLFIKVLGLHTYIHTYFIDFPQGGFRCGGAITMALTGSTLDNIVDHVGWRSHNMAKYYMQLHKSLQPASVAANTAQYKELNQLNGFEPAFRQNTKVMLPSKRQSPKKC